MKSLFKLGNKLDGRTRWILEIAGFLLLILIWFLITYATPKPVDLALLSAAEKTEIQQYVKNDTISEKGIEWLATKRGEAARSSGPLSEDEVYNLFRARGHNAIGDNTLSASEIDYFGNRRADPIVRPGILPSPGAVLKAFPDLVTSNKVFKNMFRSIGLNLSGYVEAILLAIPIGFLIGLLPFFRGLFQRQVDAFRYVPLTAVTGLFILWFGLGTDMQVHFLAFGIMIYLLPVVVQRIDEVDSVYTKTVYTLGATDWQTFKSVYFPAVVSRLSDDIRVLTAISWTYIIVAEGLGGQGGLGSLIWRIGQRQGRVDKTFALLLIIIIIGILQDRLFVYLDKKFFPYKHQIVNKYGPAKTKTIVDDIFSFAGIIVAGLLAVIYLLFFINQFTQWFMIDNEPILSYYFGDTSMVIHFLAFCTGAYLLYSFIEKRR